MRKKRYKEAELRAIYASWKDSGETQQTYCSNSGINPNIFKVELYKLRKQDQASLEQSGRFNEVKVSENSEYEPEEVYCKIVFSGKHSIEFSDKASLMGLKTLMLSLIQDI